MVDYRSRSRRVLAHLTRTAPQAAAALQGRTAHGTLMAFPSPSGVFYLLSLQGVPPAACSLRLGTRRTPLPPATAGGALWCAFLLETPPAPGMKVTVCSGAAQVAAGVLQ